MRPQARQIIVSNRLPITLRRSGSGVEVCSSSGGLVSALAPLAQRDGGCWVGWPGTGYDREVEAVVRRGTALPYALEPVFLNAEEERCFYRGFANQVVWPLFHDMPSRCRMDPEYWTVYREVNEKYADAVEAVAQRHDLIWVHDYHLMMMADALRARDIGNTLAYFHHIPFPSPDIFEKLPCRAEILRGLLQFNLVGVQTQRDLENLVACVQRHLRDSSMERLGSRLMVRAEGLCTTAGVFPIGVDFAGISREAATEEVRQKAEEIRALTAGRQLVVGIDRLDFTKGILQRLAAFRALLEKRPNLRGRVVLIQVAVPSREEIAEYRELKLAVEQQVAAINGKFGNAGWLPVMYQHRSLSRRELLAYYRAAQVALVTPVRDGMNLVAKEFCAARNDESGVLVLSEFAGAALELRPGALLVNPYDEEAIAAGVEQGLVMGEAEQRLRMRAMRQALAEQDVFRWCGSFCRAAGMGRPSATWPAAAPLAARPAPAAL